MRVSMKHGLKRFGALCIATISAFALIVTVSVPTKAQAAEGTTARAVAEQLPVVAQHDTGYDRSLFGSGWIDADRNGCNTRFEVLLRDSQTPVTRVSGTCYLEGGTWQSAYDDFIATDTDDIEIDHVVALAEAWYSGAWSWTTAERAAFSNDLGVDYALVPSSQSSNGSKSHFDPSIWVPSDDSLVCQYVTDWALIKYRWGLSVDEGERNALLEHLAGECGDREVVLPEVMRTSAPDSDNGDDENADDGESGARDDGETNDPAPRTVIKALPSGETRLAGADRYATAIDVSKRFAPGVPAVFVATGMNFPDALAASAAAAQLGAPLLLTPASAVPGNVLAEITRLDPSHIYIVGGESVVSKRAFGQLASIAPTKRYSGADRYSTGMKVVSESFDAASFAVIATGSSFPDALASTSVAGVNKAPVVLVDGVKSAVPQSVVNKLKQLGVSNIMIAGGTGVVSNGIQNQLIRAGFNVDRRGGSDRYETAALINNRWFPAGSSSHYFLATGDNFPDALAGAALAGQIGAPLYVTRATCMAIPVSKSIDALGASGRAILGSKNVVSAAVSAGTICPTVPTISGTTTVGKTLTAKTGYWPSGTKLTYQWRANGSVIGGASKATLTLAAAQQGKKITVRVTGTRNGYSTSSTSKATSNVKYPSRTNPIGAKTCPAWAPIKGNHSSSGEKIYHVPGGQFYAVTSPEECFRTASAASSAGYRASKR